MRISFSVCAVVLVGVAAFTSPAAAVVAPSNTPADFTGQWTGTNSNWSMANVPVLSFGLLSCEAVAPYAVVMAEHCSPKVGNGVLINGEVYTFTKVLNPSDGGDLALCILDHPTNDYIPLYGGPVVSGPPGTGANVVMIGYGNIGETYTNYYVPDQLNRTKHWGTNSIDSASGQYITMMYHAGDTDYEAGYGVGDSGGGTYIKDVNGAWRLVGVNDAIYSYYDPANPDQTSEYDGSLAVSIPHYYQWLVSNITIPGDTNFDGKVNFMDYINLEIGYGKTATDGVESGDFNGDGKVNFADYLILEAHFGKSAANTVPEPGTLALLAAGALWVRRGRKM